jgi:LPS sulfotransferase NodH
MTIDEEDAGGELRNSLTSLEEAHLFYLRSQVSRFVIMFQGRSGSTLLTTALDSHPRIRAAGETLAELKDHGAEAQLQMTRELLTPPLIGRHAVVGFKAKLMDVLDPEGFAKSLKEMRPSIILSLRRNSVKLVVSWINSERLHRKEGKWQSYTEEDRPSVPFIIAVDDFQCRLKTLEGLRWSLESYVSKLGLPTLSLYYEDLLTDEQKTFEQVFSFLGVKPEAVRPRCIKTTSDDLREVIKNFEDLRSHYRGTPYEEMFDEVLVPGKAQT